MTVAFFRSQIGPVWLSVGGKIGFGEPATAPSPSRAEEGEQNSIEPEEYEAHQKKRSFEKMRTPHTKNKRYCLL